MVLNREFKNTEDRVSKNEMNHALLVFFIEGISIIFKGKKLFGWIKLINDSYLMPLIETMIPAADAIDDLSC